MRRFRILALSLALTIPQGFPAFAQDYGATEAGEVANDQINLVWVAGYQGPIDGRMGARSREAVAAFQETNGFVRTGVLTDAQRQALDRVAAAEKRRLGWRMLIDGPTGMRIGVAEGILAKRSREGSGSWYEGKGGTFLMRTMVSPAGGGGSLALQANMDKAVDILKELGFRVTYSTLKDEWYAMNAIAQAEGKGAYVRMHLTGNWIRGFILITDPNAGVDLGPLVTATSLSLQPDAQEPLYVPEAKRAPGPASPGVSVAAAPVKRAVPKSPEPIGSGSGFVVAPARLVTNHHVIDECERLEVAGKGPATVMAQDKKNDLALLAVEGLRTAPALDLAAEPSRLGEDIVAMGYPLPQLLGARLNITTGIVSSTEGGGDWTQVQITAPVQGGNSGGPLLDAEGRVKGVIVAQLPPHLNAGKVVIPQQVNFAIKGDVLKGFLNGNGITLAGKPKSDAKRSTADIAEMAAPSIHRVVCIGTPKD